MTVILKFLYLDILQTDDWLLSYLICENPEYYEDENNGDEDGEELVEKRDKALNKYFGEQGIGSMILIVNLGSTLVYLAVYLNVYFIYLVLSFIPCHSM